MCTHTKVSEQGHTPGECKHTWLKSEYTGKIRNRSVVRLIFSPTTHAGSCKFHFTTKQLEEFGGLNNTCMSGSHRTERNVS